MSRLEPDKNMEEEIINVGKIYESDSEDEKEKVPSFIENDEFFGPSKRYVKICDEDDRFVRECMLKACTRNHYLPKDEFNNILKFYPPQDAKYIKLAREKAEELLALESSNKWEKFSEKNNVKASKMKNENGSFVTKGEVVIDSPASEVSPT
jgi:hypothetical protein